MARMGEVARQGGGEAGRRVSERGFEREREEISCGC
jgi:hypothetical protein